MTSPAQYTLPSGTRSSEFTIERVDAFNELASGSGYSVEIAPPYWEASFQSAVAPRRSTRYADWTSFLDNLRGSQRTALLYDPDLQYPQGYANFVGLVRYGGGAFDGTAEIDVRTSQYQFDISTLPPSFVFTRGDYVGFVKSGSPNRYFLTRLQSDTTASLTGTATIRVEPKVPALFDATCQINLYRALGEFILIPGSISRPRSVENDGNFAFRARSRVY